MTREPPGGGHVFTLGVDSGLPRRMVKEAAKSLIDRFPEQYARLAATAYHLLYYRNQTTTWENTRWLGCLIEKFPGDLIVYQEIIHERRPDWIIETGTAFGGSAVFLASICDLVRNGQIVTVDINVFDRPEHPRVTYLTGSSVDAEIVADVHRRTAKGSRMVILDSDHSRDHVARELDAYHDLVTSGDYLIVEDTNMSGHPIPSSWEGPWEAVTEFLRSHPNFRPDTSREKFYVTQNPRGYLKRQP